MPLKISDTTYFFQRCHQHLGDFCIHEYFCEFETLCENTSANTFWAQMGYNPKKPVSIISWHCPYKKSRFPSHDHTNRGSGGQQSIFNLFLHNNSSFYQCFGSVLVLYGFGPKFEYISPEFLISKSKNICFLFVFLKNCYLWQTFFLLQK